MKAEKAASAAKADSVMAKKRARSVSVSSDEAVVLREPVVDEAYTDTRASNKRDSVWDEHRADDSLHVPEDGDKVMVPDAAASSSHDVPREAPLEAAGAAALSEDAQLQRVIQDIEEEQRNADRESAME
jgi:hypothetical protein